MNISLGSKHAAQEHLAESPGSWASAESRHCEIWEAEQEEGAGRQVDANLSACPSVLRHCRGQDKGKVEAQLCDQRAPSPTVVLSLVASTTDLLSMGKSTPCTYPPGQATATLGGRVPSILETGQYSPQAERTDRRVCNRQQPGARWMAQWVPRVSLLKCMSVL